MKTAEFTLDNGSRLQFKEGHLWAIRDRFNKGFPWWLCSVIYPMSRTEIVRIALGRPVNGVWK